jgi:hypothetical protein
VWSGFWVNVLSGVVLLAADATTKAIAPMFLMKLGLVTIGVAVTAAQKREVFAPARRQGSGGQVFTRRSRTLALTSLTVWVTAIFAGRLMAYPGLFFGL